jgi:hypothetical protein
MASDIEKLLLIENDSELCSEVFDRLLEHYGVDLSCEEIDVTKLKGADRVVMLVCQASGIIGNGGFRYLFEGDGNLKGDPYFAETAQSFKTIKAKKCAEAFDEALAKFPGSRPPTDIEERIVMYHSLGGAVCWPIDQKFFSEDADKILAKWIREHREEFNHLKYETSHVSSQLCRPVVAAAPSSLSEEM